MSINSFLSKYKKWYSPLLNDFSKFLLILIGELFILRIFEFIYLQNAFDYDFIYILHSFKGIFYDIIFCSVLIILLIIPLSILYRLSAKIGRLSLHILNVVFVLLNLALIDYLKFNFIPLDHAFFAYPFKEILYIVNKSVDINLAVSIKYMVGILVSISLANFAFRKLPIKNIQYLLIISLLIGIFLSKNIVPDRRKYINDTAFNLSINKLGYLSKHSIEYFSGKSSISTIEYLNIAKKYQTIHPEFNFTGVRYPLEHLPDTSDILGPFFNLNSTPPNIVLIIMESLSSAFCGSNAYLGNFTPFLDSLINESLYWENFLSTSERTFNAIPSLTGSLPYGEKGFMECIQPHNKLNHNTIIKWLNQYNYQTNFFYGGWIGFDNMGKFLKYQNIDFLLKHYGNQYSIIEKNEKGFSWGYPDHAMYNRSLEVLDSINNSPRFDLYLTISLHNPFKPPHQTYYDSLFTARLDSLTISDKQKTETQKYAHILATALYTDNALRSFFNTYKNRKDFENTIFIITGDHRLGGHNKKNQIDTYHVPFLIYSPMLKSPQKFSSVSSHANLSPSLFSFFSKNFGFKMPEISHALGDHIDTCITFRNIHKIPFMRTSRDITDYLSNNFFISNNELFELKENMNLIKIENKQLLDSLKNELECFKIINRYTTENNLVSSHE